MLPYVPIAKPVLYGLAVVFACAALLYSVVWTLYGNRGAPVNWDSRISIDPGRVLSMSTVFTLEAQPNAQSETWRQNCIVEGHPSLGRAAHSRLMGHRPATASI